MLLSTVVKGDIFYLWSHYMIIQIPSILACSGTIPGDQRDCAPSIKEHYIRIFSCSIQSCKEFVYVVKAIGIIA